MGVEARLEYAHTQTLEVGGCLPFGRDVKRTSTHHDKHGWVVYLLLLLLLRSPARPLGFTIWSEVFAYVTVFGFFFGCFFFVVFFYPAIEVVIFRLRGWCMLGVFLLLAFTRLGHESQDRLSPCDGMYVFTD